MKHKYIYKNLKNQIYVTLWKAKNIVINLILMGWNPSFIMVWKWCLRNHWTNTHFLFWKRGYQRGLEKLMKSNELWWLFRGWYKTHILTFWSTVLFPWSGIWGLSLSAFSVVGGLNCRQNTRMVGKKGLIIH